ncbi:MAG: WD40 repeat domain-containing protein [Myxococcota bacterium]|jgi:WD40 repeat protein|nr:WD40 repeat domain-containing protein [Myxococcota bacterium]
MATPPMQEDPLSRSIPPSRQRGSPSRASRLIRLSLFVIALMFVAWTVLQLYESCGTTLNQVSDAPAAPETGARAESASGAGDVEPAFVASAASHTLFVTDAAGRRYILRHAHRGPVYALALSTRGQHLGTGDADGQVRIWSVAYLGLSSDRPVLVDELHGSLSSVDAMAFTQDERYLVVVGDDDTAVDVWDVDQRKLLHTLSLSKLGPDGAESYRVRLHLAADGKVLGMTAATAVLEYVVGAGGAPEPLPVLMDGASGEIVRFHGGIESHSYNPAKGLSWNPDGRYWGYSEGDEVRIWKLCPRGQCKQVDVDGHLYLE